MVEWNYGKAPYKDVVISTRMRLARNVKGHRFPNALDQKEADKVDHLIHEASKTLEGHDYRHVFVNTLSPLRRQVLMENHIISPELIKNSKTSSFVLREDEQVNLMINEEDHLRLQVLKPGFQLQNAYRTAMEVDEVLERSVDFAYHIDYGYLTACPTNTGTGMRASVMLHLPATFHAGLMTGLVDSLAKLGVTVRGVYGEGSEALGDMYQLSNQKTLGVSEDQTLEKMTSVIHRVISNERRLRRQFLEQNQIMMEDQIYRAYGMLTNARQLEEKEALRALSFLRVGIDLDLIEGLDLEKVSGLMFSVQKNNILMYGRLNQLQDDERVIRAGYVREFFE